MIQFEVKKGESFPLEVYDVLVIGGGPAGYSAAIRASQLGGKVALVEEDRIGGTCLNRGCIPTKALIESSNLLRLINKSTDYGIVVEKVTFDFGTIMEGVNNIVKRLVAGVEYLLKANKIRMIEGRATLTTSEMVEVVKQNGTKRLVKTKKIIIATGSKPISRALPDFDKKKAMTTDQMFELEQVPNSLLIEGANKAGIEFAFIFNALGSNVILVDSAPRILLSEDKEIAARSLQSLSRSGITIFTNTSLSKIEEKEKGEKIVFLLTKKEEKEVIVKEILLTNRKPNTTLLGLDKIGVQVEHGKIVVNDRMETNVEGVYAAGDVTGSSRAHIAYAEAVVAAENAMGMESVMNYDIIPRCVHIHPEIASVGLTEEQARIRGYNLKIGKFSFLASGGALTMRKSQGLTKIVAEAVTGEILGVHIIGPRAIDLIAEAVLAMSLETTIEEISNVVYLHPTLSEVLKEAALDAEGRPLHKVK